MLLKLANYRQTIKTDFFFSFWLPLNLKTSCKWKEETKDFKCFNGRFLYYFMICLDKMHRLVVTPSTVAAIAHIFSSYMLMTD